MASLKNPDNTELPFNKWETAYFEQFHSASIGTMFRGILHNLNGANQAFALQAALFKSMFSQADELLNHIQESKYDDQENYIIKLQNLLNQRSIMVDQMEEKLKQSHSIIHRSLPLADLYELNSEKSVSVNRIVEYEVEILSSGSFFKHEVTKNISMGKNLPDLTHNFEEVHNVVYVVLLNAIEALENIENPLISIKTESIKGTILISIENTGELPFVKNSEVLFQPFYSTKKGHLGIGLYLADQCLKKIGGSIRLDSSNGKTIVLISIP